MKTKQIIILLLTTTLISSCSIYKNYQRPEEISTNGLYGENVTKTDSTSFGELPWKELFTDPALQALIEQGILQNTDLRIADLEITAAEAALKAARQAFLPSLSFIPHGTLNAFDWQRATKTYTIPATASWQLDIFGSLRNAKKRSQVQLLQSYTYRQAVQARLIAAIANYYYTLLMLDTQLEISEQTAANWQRNIEITRALMQAGEGTDAAVSQSEANYYNVCTYVVDLKQQIREIENSFSALIGETPATIQRGQLDDWQSPGIIRTGIPALLLSNRPDVKHAEMTLAAAFYTTNEARSAFYPTLTLAGTLGWTNNEGLVNPGKMIWQALASLTQPLYQNGRLRAQLTISKARQEEAKLTFQQTLINAGAEVNTALARIQSNEERSHLYREQINSLERTVKSTRLLMQNSSANYLEVLTAQQDLLAARLAETTNRFNTIQSTIELYLALGGGGTDSQQKRFQ